MKGVDHAKEACFALFDVLYGRDGWGGFGYGAR